MVHCDIYRFRDIKIVDNRNEQNRDSPLLIGLAIKIMIRNLFSCTAFLFDRK